MAASGEMADSRMAGVTPLAQKTYSVTTPLAFWANCVRAKGLSLSVLLLLVYLADDHA